MSEGPIIPVTPTDDRALVIAAAADGTLTTALGRSALLDLERKFDSALAEAVGAGAAIRLLCGPELHGAPAHLATMAANGAGYLRHCRDVIRMMRKAKGLKR